jgi:hypothetical protein
MITLKIIDLHHDHIILLALSDASVSIRCASDVDKEGRNAERTRVVVCVETRHMQAVLKAQINKTDFRARRWARIR